MTLTRDTPTGLRGLKVLLAEDEVLIGMLIEDTLENLGCVLVGPYESLSAAVAAVKDVEFEVALIDFNLGGEKADDLAEALRRHNSPFAIVTGSPSEATGHGEIVTLGKPFSPEDIEATLRALISLPGAAAREHGN